MQHEAPYDRIRLRICLVEPQSSFYPWACTYVGALGLLQRYPPSLSNARIERVTASPFKLVVGQGRSRAFELLTYLILVADQDRLIVACHRNLIHLIEDWYFPVDSFS